MFSQNCKKSFTSNWNRKIVGYPSSWIPSTTETEHTESKLFCYAESNVNYSNLFNHLTSFVYLLKRKSKKDRPNLLHFFVYIRTHFNIKTSVDVVSPWARRTRAISVTDQSHQRDGPEPSAWRTRAISVTDQSHQRDGPEPSAWRTRAISVTDQSHQRDGPRDRSSQLN